MRKLGATSVVVVNNQPGQQRFLMAGDRTPADENAASTLPKFGTDEAGVDLADEISAVMINFEDGERLLHALSKTRDGETVSVQYQKISEDLVDIDPDNFAIGGQQAAPILAGFREILTVCNIEYFF